ncbi:MAG TPA: hypothetical protein VIM67_04740, partial [Terriglobus sp.]
VATTAKDGADQQKAGKQTRGAKNSEHPVHYLRRLDVATRLSVFGILTFTTHVFHIFLKAGWWVSRKASQEL